jgi:hypothetical protein
VKVIQIPIGLIVRRRLGQNWLKVRSAGESACATTANRQQATLVGQAFSLPGLLPQAHRVDNRSSVIRWRGSARRFAGKILVIPDGHS